jgi:hypothetical protein
MSSSTPTRQVHYARLWGQPKRIAAISTVIGAALIAAGCGFAALDPPALAWLGFGLVSVIVLGLGALAPVGFERTRVSPLPRREPVDTKQLLLVVADSHCAEAAVCDEIVARIDQTIAVHLVIPIRVSHLHFMTDDEVNEQREAEQVMEVTLQLLKQRGAVATGEVGDDKPLESLSDALAFHPATRVLLVTPPPEESYWLERDLLGKARRLTRLPITEVVAPVRTRVKPRSRHVVD